MKALSKKTAQEKEKNRVDRYIADNYEKIIYDSVAENAPYISRQAVAEFLWALVMHGYSTQKLQECFEWYLAVCNMPDQILGKTPNADDVIALMSEKHGIDFDRMQMRFQSYEDFCRERAEINGNVEPTGEPARKSQSRFWKGVQND